MTAFAARMRTVPRWKWILGAAMVTLPLLFAIGLTKDPTHIPSMIVGEKVPAFDLAAFSGTGKVSSSAFAGKPFVVNFWASWCVSCREEHPVLIALGERAARSDTFAVVGVNYRDNHAAAVRYLDRHGQFPYPSGIDGRGRLGIDFGVYGMPETFFIDADGTVRARHVGPLSDEAIAEKLEQIGVRQ